MRKKFNKDLKKDLSNVSCKKNIISDNIVALGIDRSLPFNCLKDFKEYEYSRYPELKNPNIKDLKFENICLQKLIKEAKMEQKLLKNAINTLHVLN